MSPALYAWCQQVARSDLAAEHSYPPSLPFQGHCELKMCCVLGGGGGVVQCAYVYTQLQHNT